MKKNRLLIGLEQTLLDLLQESEDIFFAERKFLEDPSSERVITDLKERRRENEQAIISVSEKISDLINANSVRRIETAEQKTLLDK